MKTPLRFLIASTMLLTLSTAVFAEGFQMDRVTAGARYVEDNHPEVYEWIYFNSNANYDWLKMNLQGKFYAQKMKDNWIDYSPDGMGDLYNGVKANFRFPALSKGLEASLGYEWNDNYDVAMWGVGYGWGFGKNLSMGVRYDEAYRNTTNDDLIGKTTTIDPSTGSVLEEEHSGDLERRQQKFYLKYSPESWSYSLEFKRIDCDYVDASHEPEALPVGYKGSGYNKDYSSISYVLDQKLTWQATEKLELGLRYLTTDSDYEDTQKLDGDSTKWVISGDYKANKNWLWSSAYSQSSYEGYNGESSTDALSVKGKYTSDSNWWYAVKLYLFDLDFDNNYTILHNNANDKDADFNTRTQQVVALEYEEKLDKFAYNLEVFAKNYAYETESATEENWQDRVDCGLIGTLTWDWASLHWKLRVAPWGDLTTRKTNAELTATYKF